MVGRILLGERNGISGLFVSRTGVDVTTATGRDLLLDPQRKQIQVIYERTLTLGEIIGASYTVIARQVVHPDFGFSPKVMMSVTYDAFLETQSNSFSAISAVSPRIYNKTQTSFYLRLYSSLRDGIYKTWPVTVVIRLLNIVSTNSATLELPRSAYGETYVSMQLEPDA